MSLHLGPCRSETPAAPSTEDTSFEGTPKTATGSAGRLNKRQLSKVDHFRLRFRGSFASPSSHFVFVIDARRWVRKREATRT